MSHTDDVAALLTLLHENGIREEGSEVWQQVLPSAAPALVSYLHELLSLDPSLVVPATRVMQCKLQRMHGVISQESMNECERKELEAILQE